MLDYLIIGNINGNVEIFLTNLYKYICYIQKKSFKNFEVKIDNDVLYSLELIGKNIICYDHTNKRDIDKLTNILTKNNVIEIRCSDYTIIPINQIDFNEHSLISNSFIFIVGNVFNINKQDKLLFYLMEKFKLCMKEKFNIMINSNDIDYIQNYINDFNNIQKYYKLYSDYWESGNDIVVAHKDIIDNCVENLIQINEQKFTINKDDEYNKINRTNNYKKCINSINTVIDQLLDSIYKAFKAYDNFNYIYTDKQYTSYINLIEDYFKKIATYYNSDTYYNDEYINIYDVFGKIIHSLQNNFDYSKILYILKIKTLRKRLYYKIINLEKICEGLNDDFLDYIDRYNLTKDHIDNVCDIKIKLIKDIIDGKLTHRYINLFNSSDLTYQLKINNNTEQELIYNQTSIHNIHKYNTIIRQYIPKFSFDINDLIYYDRDTKNKDDNIMDPYINTLYRAKLYKYYTKFNDLAVKIIKMNNKNMFNFLKDINNNMLSHNMYDLYKKYLNQQKIQKINNKSIFYICIKIIRQYIYRICNNYKFENMKNVKIDNIFTFFYKYYKSFYEEEYNKLNNYKNYDHQYNTQYNIDLQQINYINFKENENDQFDKNYIYDMVKYKNGNLIIYNYDSSRDITLTKKGLWDNTNKRKLPYYNYMFVNKLNILPIINKQEMLNSYRLTYSLIKSAFHNPEKNATNIYIINNNENRSFMTFKFEEENHTITGNSLICDVKNYYSNNSYDDYMNNIYNLYNDITCLQILINNCIEFIQHPKYDKKQIIKYFLFIIYAYFSKINNSNYQIFNDSDKIFNDIGDMIKNNNNIVYDNTQLVYKNISDENKNISLNNIDKIINTFLNIDNDVMKQLYKKSELAHDDYKTYVTYMNYINHETYYTKEALKFTYKYIYSSMNNYSIIKYYKLLQDYIDNKASCMLNINTINTAIETMYLYVNQIIAQNEEIYYKIHKIAKAEYILIIKILSKIICHIPCLFIDLLCDLKDNKTDKIYNYANDKIAITKLEKDIDIIVHNPKLKELKNGTLENDIQINNQYQMYTYQNDYDITYDDDGNISFTLNHE